MELCKNWNEDKHVDEEEMRKDKRSLRTLGMTKMKVVVRRARLQLE